jgi:PAS domain S-box-containing protein
MQESLPTLDQVRMRLAVCLALTWLTPGVLLYITFALRELPDWITSYAHLGISSFVLSPLMTGLAILIMDRMIQRVLADTAQNTVQKSVPDVQKITRLFTVYGGLLLTYILIGLVSMLLQASQKSGAPIQSPPALLVATIVTLLLIYAGLPYVLYGMTLLGRVLGPILGDRAIFPWRLKMILSGPVVVVMSVTSFIAYAAVFDSSINSALVFVGFNLTLYAAILSWLVYDSYRISQAPIDAFLRQKPIDANAAELIPQSLDETGIAVRELGLALSQLKESEERFKQFAEAASDYFFEIDKDMKFSYLSNRFEEVVGVPPDHVIGLPATAMSALYEVDDYDNHASDLETHKPYRNYQFELDVSEGVHKHIEVSAVPHFDRDGNFLGYRGAGTDVTDLVETRKSFEEQQAMLLQIQKMEVVGQLTGGVAHDFNNLLAVILGNLELLQLSSLGQDQQSYLESAISASEKGATLVQRLLAFSRKQTLNPEVINPFQVVTSMQELMTRTLPKNINLQIDAPEENTFCFIDRLQFENAVLNLAINSRDAMPRGGELTFTFKPTTLKNHLFLADGDYCSITIADTGEGMHAEVANAAFEPFFTTKETGKGSGLGLSMVYGLLKQSNGTASITSVKGEGTSVTLIIPASQAQAELAETIQSSTTIAHGRGEHLLIVESNSDVRQLLSKQLQNIGYTITAVGDAETAQGLIRQENVYHLVLTDIVGGGTMNGTDLGKQIATEYPDLCVLYLVGQADTSLEIDNSQFVRKPFKSYELAEKINHLLSLRATSPGATKKSVSPIFR